PPGHLVEPRDEGSWRLRTGELGERREFQIEAIERAAFGLVAVARDRRVGEDGADDKRAWERQKLAKALAFVHRARFAADFGVGLAEERVVDVDIDGDQLHPR